MIPLARAFRGRLASLALASLLAPSLQGSDEPRILWRGDEVTREFLRTEVGAETAGAVGRWWDFCTAQGYDLHVEESGVALLFAPQGTQVELELALLERTMAIFERLLPVTGRPTRWPEVAPPSPEVRRWRRAFARAQSLLERDTLLLFALRGRKDYAAVLDEMVRQAPYLASWAEATKRYPGFVATTVFTSAWLRSESGNQDLDPKNDLVNGFARLLVERRFGSVPHWLGMGIAWQIELELLGVLFTYPHRPDQVVTVEGTGWLQELRRLHKKRKPFDLDPLAGWSPAAWDRRAAVLAFGLTRFLVEERSGDLPELLDHLSALFWEKGRRPSAGGGWVLDATFQPSAEDQRLVLERRLGAEVLTEAATFLRTKQSGGAWLDPLAPALPGATSD